MRTPRISNVIAPLLLVIAMPGALSAAVISVNGGGPGTPLQDAIDAASPGDTLLLTGVFREAIVIDKRLSLRGWATINPPCGPDTIVTVAADGVRLRRLIIYGGAVSSIDVQGRDGVRIARSFVASQPFEGGCDAAAVGIDIAASTNLKLSRTETLRSGAGTRYSTAFIRVSAIAPGARVKIVRAFSNYDNTVGILVADSDTLPARPAGLILAGNQIVQSLTGILVSKSAGIQLNRNRASGGDIGILVDSQSHDNRLIANSGTLNNLIDARDDGFDNCWKKNDFTTSQVPAC